MLTCPSCGTENPGSARFCNGCAVPLEAPVGSRETRRTVTALFCDLVGSTTLGETHDPEVLRPVFERYFEEMRAAVGRHGGLVQKYIGDADRPGPRPRRRVVDPGRRPGVAGTAGGGFGRTERGPRARPSQGPEQPLNVLRGSSVTPST